MAENRFKKSIGSLEHTEKSQDNVYKKNIDTPHITERNNILEKIICPKESSGKNYTFYLTTEVGDQLEKIAKQKRMSKSKLVNSILKEILK